MFTFSGLTWNHSSRLEGDPQLILQCLYKQGQASASKGWNWDPRGEKEEEKGVLVGKGVTSKSGGALGLRSDGSWAEELDPSPTLQAGR